jgi:mannosyltransferase OCH1-like enzyme
MEQRILEWMPICLFLFIVVGIRHFFDNFNNNAWLIILEKTTAVLLLLAYGYKSIHFGIIAVMIMILFYTINIDQFKKEGFGINEIGDKIGDLIDLPKKRIPKRIIQLWKTWSSKKPEMFSNYIKTLKDKNPNYEYMFFKDEQIDEFLETNYPQYYETYKKLPLNIQKVDFCRYVILYHYGGFYFDLDITALEPLDELLDNECIFPVDENINKSMCSAKRFNRFCNSNINFLLGQYGFACCPKNKFVKLLVDVIHHNVSRYADSYVANSEDYVYATTGPDFVTSLYMNYADKDNITILHYNKRQYFGKYAKHNYAGTWKTNANN